MIQTDQQYVTDRQNVQAKHKREISDISNKLEIFQDSLTPLDHGDKRYVGAEKHPNIPKESIIDCDERDFVLST